MYHHIQKCVMFEMNLPCVTYGIISWCVEVASNVRHVAWVTEGRPRTWECRRSRRTEVVDWALSSWDGTSLGAPNAWRLGSSARATSVADSTRVQAHSHGSYPPTNTITTISSIKKHNLDKIDVYIFSCLSKNIIILNLLNWLQVFI